MNAPIAPGSSTPPQPSRGLWTWPLFVGATLACSLTVVVSYFIVRSLTPVPDATDAAGPGPTWSLFLIGVVILLDVVLKGLLALAAYLSPYRSCIQDGLLASFVGSFLIGFVYLAI